MFVLLTSFLQHKKNGANIWWRHVMTSWIFFNFWQILRQKAPWRRLFCKKPGRYVNLQRFILQKIKTEYNYLYYFFQEQIFKNVVFFPKFIFFDDVIKKWQPFWKKNTTVVFLLWTATRVPIFMATALIFLKILRGGWFSPPPGPEEPLKTPVHIGLRYFWVIFDWIAISNVIPKQLSMKCDKNSS